MESGLSSEKDVENSPEGSEGLIDSGVNIDKQIELLENKKLQLQRQEKVNRLQKLQEEVKELERSLDIPSGPKAQERSTKSSNQHQQNNSEVSIKELREMEELNKKADHYMKQFQLESSVGPDEDEKGEMTVKGKKHSRIEIKVSENVKNPQI